MEDSFTFLDFTVKYLHGEREGNQKVVFQTRDYTKNKLEAFSFDLV